MQQFDKSRRISKFRCRPFSEEFELGALMQQVEEDKASS
jgi:hypothetical protein